MRLDCTSAMRGFCVFLMPESLIDDEMKMKRLLLHISVELPGLLCLPYTYRA